MMFPASQQQSQQQSLQRSQLAKNIAGNAVGAIHDSKFSGESESEVRIFVKLPHFSTHRAFWSESSIKRDFDGFQIPTALFTLYGAPCELIFKKPMRNGISWKRQRN
jgi:hypothetical protein